MNKQGLCSKCEHRIAFQNRLNNQEPIPEYLKELVKKHSYCEFITIGTSKCEDYTPPIPLVLKKDSDGNIVYERTLDKEEYSFIITLLKTVANNFLYMVKYDNRHNRQN